MITYPKLFSAEQGEFIHHDSNGVGLDKVVSRAFFEIMPMLRRVYTRYNVTQRLEGGERFLGVNGLDFTYSHFIALLQIPERMEFVKEISSTLPTLLAQDYISTAQQVTDFPMVLEENVIPFVVDDPYQEIPGTALTAKKLFMSLVLKDGPQGMGYYPEFIRGVFASGPANLTYDLSWDFFLGFVTRPKVKLVLNLDYHFDQTEKWITIIPPPPEPQPEEIPVPEASEEPLEIENEVQDTEPAQPEEGAPAPSESEAEEVKDQQ